MTELLDLCLVDTVASWDQGWMPSWVQQEAAKHRKKSIIINDNFQHQLNREYDRICARVASAWMLLLFSFYQTPGCDCRQEKPRRTEARSRLGGWQSGYIWAQTKLCLRGSGTCVKKKKTIFWCFSVRLVPLSVLLLFQDDIMMGTLSVRENLLFSANLRLTPKYYSSEDKKSKVNEIIQDLGLTDCADTKVSSWRSSVTWKKDASCDAMVYSFAL